MERTVGKAAGGECLFIAGRRSGWQMQRGPETAGGEVGHGAAKPHDVIHRCLVYHTERYAVDSISSYLPFRFCSLVLMDFDNGFFFSCVTIAAQQEGSPVSRTVTFVVSPTTPAFGGLDLTETTKDVAEALASDFYPGAFSDFYGLPTNPVSVYKTGDAWPVRKGPEAQRVPREARPVCNHPILDVWPKLGKQVYTFLDSLDVKWSTIDPVRFAEEGGEAGPLYLWVGVVPRSLSFEGAKAAADGCKKILTDAHFPDVEIAFRESVFTRSTGPRLLNHVPSVDPTADIRIPFTPALGVQIAPKDTPYFEGTGALYLRESSQSDRVFLLTARHVALPPAVHDNKLYELKNSSKPRQAVLILGSKAYTDALEAMMAKIGHEVIFVDTYKREIEALGEAAEGEDAGVAKARQKLQGKLVEAEETIKDVYKFHSDITKHWSTPSQRVFGHVVYAPAISVSTGPKQFTEDWALIDLNRDRIDWNVFKGNVVSLGTFRSILPRSSSLTIISRKHLSRRLRAENAPSSPGPLLLQISGRRPLES